MQLNAFLLLQKNSSLDLTAKVITSIVLVHLERGVIMKPVIVFISIFIVSCSTVKNKNSGDTATSKNTQEYRRIGWISNKNWKGGVHRGTAQADNNLKCLVQYKPEQLSIEIVRDISLNENSDDDVYIQKGTVYDGFFPHLMQAPWAQFDVEKTYGESKKVNSGMYRVKTNTTYGHFHHDFEIEDTIFTELEIYKSTENGTCLTFSEANDILTGIAVIHVR